MRQMERPGMITRSCGEESSQQYARSMICFDSETVVVSG